MPARSEAQRRYLNAHFGHEWVKDHDFDNKGKLPDHVEKEVPESAHYRLAETPDQSCETCIFYFGGQCEMFDTPVMANMTCDKWDGELPDVMKMASLIDSLAVRKGTSRYAELLLRVNGVSSTPSGLRVYRMVTREGHYVGRTNPTRVRARKGEVLMVEANDFSMDERGDLRWQNPNVLSGIRTEEAHSWSELEEITGAVLWKEGPTTGGDMPPATDQGQQLGMPSAETLAASGPTLQDVHVNRPLKNISINYAGKRRKLGVKKADTSKQMIYGVVLEPNVLDSQDDFMYPDQVEQAAHSYMKRVVRGKASVSKLQHSRAGFFKNKPSVVPVESFIAPCDFSYDGQEMVKKGTWVLGLHVEDPSIWNDVLDGKYTGLSIGGSGIRQEASVPHEYMVGEPSWAGDNGVMKRNSQDADKSA